MDREEFLESLRNLVLEYQSITWDTVYMGLSFESDKKDVPDDKIEAFKLSPYLWDGTNFRKLDLNEGENE